MRWMLVVALFLGATFSVVPAVEATSQPSGLVMAAHNGSVQVGARSDGALLWKRPADVVWQTSGTVLSKNGVSNLYWNGQYFVATSFFSVATSTDGRRWTTMTTPVGEGFNPGNIVSDREFFARGSMSSSSIQAFLDSKLPQCTPGFTCLNAYREVTFDRSADAMCRAYQSPGRETAAQIIARVSEACGVSAEMLLVLLQKEQSLVTHTAPSAARYDRATGYACPDTAPCNERFFGFYNQVYNAARQFQRYKNPPGTSRFFTWYPVGTTSNVLFHPNRACGTMPVLIRNQATAGLYYYTPYTPNAASLQAFSGTGDSCSSYGNRNFWRIYNLWFSDKTSYTTWYANRGSVHLIIDRDGTVARVNSSLTGWTMATRIPGSNTHSITRVGNLTDGTIAVVRQDRRVYSTVDGLTWTRISNDSTVLASSWSLDVVNGELQTGAQPPTNVSVQVSDSITVTWSAPANRETVPVRAYRVHVLDKRGRVLGSTPEFPSTNAAVESISLSADDFNVPLRARTSYRVGVSALGETGESQMSQRSTQTFSVRSPSAPLGVHMMEPESLTITWSSPATTGGSPVTHYRVELFNSRGRPLGISETVASVPGDTQSVRLLDTQLSQSLIPGTQYRIAVIAVNSLGDSPRPKRRDQLAFSY